MAGKRKGTDDERYLWGEMLRAIQEIKPTFVIAENVAGILSIDDGLVFEQVCLDLEAEGYEVQPFVLPAAAKNAPHRRDRCWFIATNSECERLERSTKVRRNGINVERKSKFRDATNTDGIRLEHTTQGGNIQESTRTPQEERRNVAKSIKTNGIDGNATDTPSTRRRQDNGRGKSRLNDKKSSRNNWDNFPTQSPICGGDDGLPTELDRITFSTWRRESIKGYGNAIVPQIALEIFKQLEKIYLEL